MKISRTTGAEKWILERSKAWLAKQERAEGLHVSDLLYPRKGYWRSVDPRGTTDDEALYFIAGQGHHYILEAIIEGSKKVGKADGGSYEWRGIHYSPDILSPHPIEIKTTRAKHGPKAETERSYAVEYEHYLKQLTAYCAIRGECRGDLVVLYLNKEGADGRSKPTVRWYRIELTAQELGKRQAELLAGKQALERAIKTKNHVKLPLCPKWLCRGCQWVGECKPWETSEGYRDVRPKSILTVGGKP